MNVPRWAITLVAVGAGPRWYGLVCAPPGDGVATNAPSARATAASAVPTVDRLVLMLSPPRADATKLTPASRSASVLTLATVGVNDDRAEGFGAVGCENAFYIHWPRAVGHRSRRRRGSDDRSDRRALHDHLGRLPRRGQPQAVPRVPRPPVPRRLRRLARQVQEPVPRPRRHPALPQLGQRDAQRPAGGRRHRGRGRVPQHRAAVLPELRAVRPAAEARGLRAPARRHPGPQPVARRLVRRVPRAARRHRPDLPQRRRRRASRTSGSSRSTACGAASCCPTSRPT